MSDNHRKQVATIHRPLVLAVKEIVSKIMFEGRYADKVIEQSLKSNPKWGARDRAFIAESVYEIVRWWRSIAYQCGATNPNENHLTKIITQYYKNQLGFLPEFEDTWDFTSVKQKAVVVNESAIKLSVPDWMYELGVSELGEETWRRELAYMNKQALVSLRTNTLKTNKELLVKSLEQYKIYTEPHTKYDEVLLLKRKINLFTTDAFKSGMFELQDTGSQQIAKFLGVKKGSRVVDACAGAGGKTLHLAALLENTGKILALDTENWKLNELKIRARRAGANNIETRLIDSTKVIKRLYDSADYLLLDVPCSGLGVLRRNPDAKWKLSLEFINKVKDTQSFILNEYSKIVKVGGEMVYATCSLMNSENRQQVDKFLQSEAGKLFEIVQDTTLYPSENDTDGFYMCRLKRVS